MITVNEILGKKNIKKAFLSIEKKTYNKKKYDELVEYFELNKETIKNKIVDNTYILETIKLKEILNYNGKRRLIATLELKDKLIARATMQVIEKYVTPTLSSNSYAYIENRGTLEAVKKIMKICRKYLIRVQNSVFEGQITESKLNKLKLELSKNINPKVDNICIYSTEFLNIIHKEEIGSILMRDKII